MSVTERKDFYERHHLVPAGALTRTNISSQPMACRQQVSLYWHSVIRGPSAHPIASLVNLRHSSYQGLSQNLETGCLKLAIAKFLGIQIFKGEHNILIFLPYTCTCIHLSK